MLKNKHNTTDIQISITSLERLKRLLVELDMIFSKRNPQHQASADLEAVLRDNKLDELTPRSAAQLRATITEIVAKSPVVKIITPSVLDAPEQQTIAKWFRDNVNERLIVSFRTDTQLLAGMVLQTPSKRYDFSLAGGLDKGRSSLIAKVAV